MYTQWFPLIKTDHYFYQELFSFDKCSHSNTAPPKKDVYNKLWNQESNFLHYINYIDYIEHIDHIHQIIYINYIDCIDCIDYVTRSWKIVYSSINEPQANMMYIVFKG